MVRFKSWLTVAVLCLPTQCLPMQITYYPICSKICDTCSAHFSRPFWYVIIAGVLSSFFTWLDYLMDKLFTFKKNTKTQLLSFLFFDISCCCFFSLSVYFEVQKKIVNEFYIQLFLDLFHKPVTCTNLQSNFNTSKCLAVISRSWNMQCLHSLWKDVQQQHNALISAYIVYM